MSITKKAIILFFLSIALFVLMDLRRTDHSAPMCLLEQTGDILPCDTPEAEITALIDKSLIPISK